MATLSGITSFGFVFVTLLTLGYLVCAISKNTSLVFSSDDVMLICDEDRFTSLPEQLISTFNIENENVEVILQANGIAQHIPVYVVEVDGVKLKKLQPNHKITALYSSQDPTAGVKVELHCNKTGYKMTGFVKLHNKVYSVIQDSKYPYQSHQYAQLVSMSTSGNSDKFDSELKSDRQSRFLFNEISKPTYQVEVMIVVDYSLYAIFYNKEDGDLEASERSRAAQQAVQEYVGEIMSSVNLAYKSLTTHSLNIEIVPVAALISTNEKHSPWIIRQEELSTLVDSSGRRMVNGTAILKDLEAFIGRLSALPTPDHSLLLTRYNLDTKGSQEHDAVGYAGIGAICSHHSTSVVHDALDFTVVSVIAHEIGHSLGAKHDGDSNMCNADAGNIMAPKVHRNQLNEWIFSECSANYFKNTVNNLNRFNTNCLQIKNYPHVSHDMEVYTKQWFGQSYNADKQCELIFGHGSYLDRWAYDGPDGYANICLNLKCKDPNRNYNYIEEAGDGTICGHNKWCIKGHCTVASVSINVPDNCPQGEKDIIVRYGRSCSELVRWRPQDCYDDHVRKTCCMSCAHIKSFSQETVNLQTIPSANDQCIDVFGTSSYFCQTSPIYKNSYATVCPKMFCLTNKATNMCTSIMAADGTPCGYKQWCVRGSCVFSRYTNDAPADCLYGDKSDWCRTGIPNSAKKHMCYFGSNADICCNTCAKFINTSNPDCLYGDKSDWCKQNIPDVTKKNVCYTGNNANICCDTCNKFGNKSASGCEYGDRANNCLRQNCNRYSFSDRTTKCCETCS